jgi:hypothetical protein
MKNNYLLSCGRIELIQRVESKIGRPEILITVNHNQNIDNNRFDWSKLIVGDYSNLDWSKIPPVDSSLLDKMGNCERIFLKMSERNFSNASYQFRKNLYIKHLRFWNYNLTERIDYAIFENIPHEGFDFIIYELCKIKCIKTLCFYTLPVRPYKSVLMHCFTDLFNPGYEIKKTYNKLSSEYIDKDEETLNFNIPNYLLNYILEHNKEIENIVSFTRAEKKNIHTYIKKLEIKKNIYGIFRHLSVLSFSKLMNRIITKLYRDSYFENDRIVEKFYNKYVIEPDFNKSFIYFPLHFQPEGSTSPIGGNYVDQALVCEMLSWVAGPEILIYIKEHPRSSKVDYIRNLAFYKRLLSCKNVKFLDRNYNSYNLIDKSIAVATVTGSAGWESFLRKKQVLMFGSRFYESAPGVFKIYCIEDLEKALKIVINKEQLITTKQIMLYLKSLESHVFEGFIPECDLKIATVSREENDENISSIIKNYVVNQILYRT